MKRYKKIISLFLTGFLAAGILSGCGSGEKKTDSSAADSSTDQNEGEKENKETGKSNEKTDNEPYEVVIVEGGRFTQEALDAVSEKLSEITQEKIGNTTVKMIGVSQGTYVDQLNMMLSSGEQVDLCLVAIDNAQSVAFMKNANQLLPLDSLLEEYGQDILANVPEEWLKAGKIGTEQYSIPGDRGKGSGIGFFMVKEVADAIGVNVEDVKDLDDVEEVLKKVKDAFPDMYPLAPDVGGYNPMPVAYDPVYGYLGCIPDVYEYKDGDPLVNFYETEQYKDWTSTMYKWMKEGLVMPDGANSTVTNKSLMAAGKVACAIRNTDPDPEGEWSDAVGKEVVVSELLNPKLYAATHHAGWQVGIGSTSQNPERAMQVLNLISADVDFANTLCFGVEGVHYQIKDAAKNTIEYLPGQDGSSTEYESIWGRFPQGFDIYVPLGRPDNFWEILEEFNEECVFSPAYGFSYDPSNVQNETAACANVISKYDAPLQCGMLDPEIELPKFIEELKAAGADKIIADKQQQFDEWKKVTANK